jgi:hypothetical protein
MTRLELLERLQQLQQTPKFQNRDICTISAVLTKEALAKHVEVCESAVMAAAAKSGPDARLAH